MAFYVNKNEKNKKIKSNTKAEVIVQIAASALNKTKMSEEGVHNILTTMYSRFLEDRDHFSIYSKKCEALILVKKERKIENKTVITAYDVIDGNIFINTGLMTQEIDEILD